MNPAGGHRNRRNSDLHIRLVDLCISVAWRMETLPDWGSFDFGIRDKGGGLRALVGCRGLMLVLSDAFSAFLSYFRGSRSSVPVS